ncbi:MAG: ribonuclease III [Pseudomonadota bacterium]|nr:ribonuclease III [Pseudomonadota bacterium]
MNGENNLRLDTAAEALGHDFGRPELLLEALTHASARTGRRSYERFEFLGDRVLGLVIAHMLHDGFPGEDEGALAKRLAALVQRQALAQVAAELDIDGMIEMSKGEEDSGGRANPALLADAMEALIAALYLDGGLATAEGFVRRHWSAMMEAMAAPPQDAKTELQEWAQGAGRPLPRYTTIAEQGPAHDPMFEVEVKVNGQPTVAGMGRSKRAAEQAAAGALLAMVAK